MWVAAGEFLAIAARWIWAFGARYIPRIFAQILVVFGLTVVTTHYAGPSIKAAISAQVAGLSPTAAQLMGYLKIDVAITIILSAVAVNLGSRVLLRAKPAP
jgi:glucan phosphoethanolaminetransferase (alkaline phosphatase superfamily)